MSDKEKQLAEQLSPLRQQIDALDRKLLDLLSERARVAMQVGEVKQKFDAPVFRPERELQVMAKMQQANPGPIDGESIAAIWREIISACRGLEKRLTVAYLGPAGTFSEQAAHVYFGHAIDGLACGSFDEVFRTVESGGASYGVVPVENSTEGAVSRTLDLLLRSPLKITGELDLPIHHYLMTASGNMQGVTSVRAHAQALAQCQAWLNANYPGVERQAVSSNAEGARLAAQDKTCAAIASEEAGVKFGLLVVRPDIQDDPYNRTRFAVIGRDEPDQGDHDQTSLIISVSTEPGSVHRMLEPLARHGVSMSRLESRPARNGGNWEYYFYIDIAGHQRQPEVAKALDELRKQAAFFKLLGSYPRSR
ncbi:MAG: prephenate dehydratase [Candidatus Protistobacter heckmanni]|nr:prephenate dehydratase [Candidatus Protistobacter heckmanni]